MKVAISAADVKTRGTYGAIRLQADLQADGFSVGRDRLARLRRELGIACKQKRKVKATTHSNHDLPVADNLLGQCFEATAPNAVWHTDITSIATGEGWLYLAGVKDQFTGEIVGTAQVGALPGVRCAITGRAWITAFHQYVLDPSDPLPVGYRLSDTWPNN